MNSFKAIFEITSSKKCPLCYAQGEYFVLTSQAVELPAGRSSCLILVRELTELLFSLLPHAESNFAPQSSSTFTCGGCTGLIKFQLTDHPAKSSPDALPKELLDAGNALVIGRLEALLPAELLQVLHMHQKTGRLLMEFEDKTAQAAFRDGKLISARFGPLDDHEAIYAVLAEKKGTFRFIPGLPEFLVNVEEVGDFMTILMEGLRRLDEEADALQNEQPVQTG